MTYICPECKKHYNTRLSFIECLQRHEEQSKKIEKKRTEAEKALSALDEKINQEFLILKNLVNEYNTKAAENGIYKKKKINVENSEFDGFSAAYSFGNKGFFNCTDDLAKIFD